MECSRDNLPPLFSIADAQDNVVQVPPMMLSHSHCFKSARVRAVSEPSETCRAWKESERAEVTDSPIKRFNG